MFNKGDRVFLKTDSAKAEGTVTEILFERIYVRWDIGRGWIYAANELELVTADDYEYSIA